jgi:hypothetical protein
VALGLAAVGLGDFVPTLGSGEALLLPDPVTEIPVPVIEPKAPVTKPTTTAITTIIGTTTTRTRWGRTEILTSAHARLNLPAPTDQPIGLDQRADDPRTASQAHPKEVP